MNDERAMRAYPCRCTPRFTCPRCEALIADAEWERGAYDEPDFDFDYHYPRDLAPRGL